MIRHCSNSIFSTFLFTLKFISKMSTVDTASSLLHIESRALQADNLIALLHSQLSELTQLALKSREKSRLQELKRENCDLSKQIEQCKEELIRLQVANGRSRNPVSSRSLCSHSESKLSIRSIVKRSPDSKNLDTHVFYVHGGFVQCEYIENGTRVWHVREEGSDVWRRVVYGHRLNNYLNYSPVYIRADDGKWYKYDNMSLVVKHNWAKFPVYEGVDDLHLAEQDVPLTTRTTGFSESNKTDGGTRNPVEIPKRAKAVPKADETPKKVGKKDAEPAPIGEPVADVGRLDLRVGRIMEVNKHPDADSLYVEQVDIGQPKLLTVVSGLVKHVPMDDLFGRLVIVLCNMKPAKMRGILSEAMVMCASTPNRVELLNPPPASMPGDVILFEGYPHNPDTVLNPKKKVFETIAQDLKTNAQRVATYKGVEWTVLGRGVVTATSLTDASIK